MADQVVTRHQGEGTPLWMLGGLYEFKATADETGGGMTVVEMMIPAGMGPPPHIHDGAEAVYVIEGAVRYHIAGEVVEGRAGSFFYIPEGVLEAFEPTELSRLLVIYAPGKAIHKFFLEAAEPAQTRELPPPPEGPPDVERLTAIAARHGLTIPAPETV
jgi:quercetin dioxygenase-like cupin family protein